MSHQGLSRTNFRPTEYRKAAFTKLPLWRPFLKCCTQCCSYSKLEKLNSLLNGHLAEIKSFILQKRSKHSLKCFSFCARFDRTRVGGTWGQLKKICLQIKTDTSASCSFRGYKMVLTNCMESNCFCCRISQSSFIWRRLLQRRRVAHLPELPWASYFFSILQNLANIYMRTNS